MNRRLISRIPLTLVLAFSWNITIIANSSATGKENYDVIFYFLNLNVSDSSTYISGSTSIHIKSVAPSLEMAVFDFSSDLITDSVRVNDKKAEYLRAAEEIRVNLDQAITGNQIARIEIFYHGLGQHHNPSGIHNKYSSSWNKNITWTLTEPFYALSWFPCKQSLTDKADSVYVFLSTDKWLKAGSNGILTAQIPLPGDRVRYEWKSKYPIVYYLISLTVSDYMDYSFYVYPANSDDSILIQNYIYNDSAYLKQNISNINKTADLMLLYSDLFGPYPFADEKYGHCVAPFSGGMEHQTMTTLVNFSFLLVAHELSHQWFGDYITCATWQDIWINEGFASYSEYLANQYLVSQTEADRWIGRCNDYIKSLPGGSVYVPEEFASDEGRIFDSRLSYNKGASIIHMLRQETGNDSLFFNILQTFIQQNKNGNVTGVDFKNHVEEKTGKDFDQFFDQWYFGQGYPLFSIRWHHRNDTLYISSLQSVSSVTPFFNVLFELKINLGEQDTLMSFRQTSQFNEWQVYLPGIVTSVIADPHRWLLGDISDITIVPEHYDSGFLVIPNPAKDKIRIQLDEPSAKYIIYIANQEGKIIKTITSASQVEELNVRSYPSGMYFVIIKKGTESRQRKFVIN